VQGGGFGSEHPKVAAARASARERLQKQEEGEARSREALVKQAAGYLEKFYQVCRPAHSPRTPRHLLSQPRTNSIPLLALHAALHATCLVL
jgi:hypothetical protein